jgi:DNA-binding IclR family transcriptional regulator
LRQLHQRHRAEALATDFARDWDGLLENLKRIRNDGFAITHGELDPDLVGLAVPLVSSAHRVVASLGFVMSSQRFSMLDRTRAVAALASSAERSLSELNEAYGSVKAMEPPTRDSILVAFGKADAESDQEDEPTI